MLRHQALPRGNGQSVRMILEENLLTTPEHVTHRRQCARWFIALWVGAMPRGSSLTEDAWERRHRSIQALLWLMIACTVPYSLHVHRSIERTGLMALPALAALAGAHVVRSRDWRSTFVTFGLFASATTYVYLAGGVTEAHFIYFVLVGVISLYQDWRPFLLAIAYVLVDHLVLGLLVPSDIFASHDGAMPAMATLRLASIHASFLLVSTVASIVAWKTSEVQALSDVLTGLPNRRLLIDELERLITTAPEPGSAVLFLDLCGFKKVNDVYGHNAGDALLVEIAARLRRTTRRQDTVARIGGDEFVIVLAGTDVHGAIAAARRVAEICAEPIVVDARAIRVAVSVGVVVTDHHMASDAAEMLRDADLAMYSAKRRYGDVGGFAMFAQDMSDDARAQFELELDLRDCVEHDQLSVVFQPIVDLVSSKTIGAESLVRWNHPTRGLLGPELFIPLAERTGVITKIGRWVLAESIHQLTLWQAIVPGIGDFSLHVNLSTVQLKDPRLVPEVHRLLVLHDIEPAALVLEITESAMLGGDVDRAVLCHLKELGVRLALDDFGTGYSSLSNLARLPVDELKIDKSFTDDVPVGPNRTLMAGVLALAGQIGIRPVIEGIESAQQVRELLAMGGRTGQGFFYSAPISSGELVQRLATERSTPVAPRGELGSDMPIAEIV